LYALIPPDSDGILIEELARQANLDSELTRRVLHVLSNYDLIRVS
jgi:hypothetical protein